jgi:hypothetical protein
MPLTLRAVTIVNGSDLSIEWFAVVPLLVQPQMEIIDIAHKNKVRMETKGRVKKRMTDSTPFFPILFFPSLTVLPFVHFDWKRTQNLEQFHNHYLTIFLDDVYE